MEIVENGPGRTLFEIKKGNLKVPFSFQSVGGSASLGSTARLDLDHSPLLMAVENQTIRWVVRRYANSDTVTDDNADIKSAHFSAQASNNLNIVVERDFIKSASTCVHDLTF